MRSSRGALDPPPWTPGRYRFRATVRLDGIDLDTDDVWLTVE